MKTKHWAVAKILTHRHCYYVNLFVVQSISVMHTTEIAFIFLLEITFTYKPLHTTVLFIQVFNYFLHRPTSFITKYLRLHYGSSFVHSHRFILLITRVQFTNCFTTFTGVHARKRDY